MSGVGMQLLLACSSMVNVETMNALIMTESHYNPFVIAVVRDKQLERQPKTKEEAEVAIDWLESQGKNYSVGLGQINKSNFAKYGVTGKVLLDGCTNIKISEKILAQCYKDSPNKSVAEALSCYYSGNYSYGFVKENIGNESSAYVERVIGNFKDKENLVVPSIKAEIPQALSKVRKPKRKINYNESTGVKTRKTAYKPKGAKTSSTQTANAQLRKARLVKNLSVVQKQAVQDNHSTFKF